MEYRRSTLQHMPYSVLGPEPLLRVFTQDSRQTRGSWNLEAFQVFTQLVNCQATSFFQNSCCCTSQLLYPLKVGATFPSHAPRNTRLIHCPFVKDNFFLHFQPFTNRSYSIIVKKRVGMIDFYFWAEKWAATYTVIIARSDPAIPDRNQGAMIGKGM